MKAESLFTGWPKTRLIKDGQGRDIGYRVTASYLTPGGARIADICGVVFGIYAATEIVPTLFHLDTRDEVFWALAGAGLFLGGSYQFFRILMRTVSVVEFRVETIMVARGWRVRTLRRDLPYQFDLEEDEKAGREAYREERKRLELQLQGKKTIPHVKKYYRESLWVVMRHLGERVDVARVFGRRRAEKLAARLQAVETAVPLQGADESGMGARAVQGPYGGHRPSAD